MDKAHDRDKGVRPRGERSIDLLQGLDSCTGMMKESVRVNDVFEVVDEASKLGFLGLVFLFSVVVVGWVIVERRGGLEVCCVAIEVVRDALGLSVFLVGLKQAQLALLAGELCTVGLVVIDRSRVMMAIG